MVQPKAEAAALHGTNRLEHEVFRPRGNFPQLKNFRPQMVDNFGFRPERKSLPITGNGRVAKLLAPLVRQQLGNLGRAKAATYCVPLALCTFLDTVTFRPSDFGRARAAEAQWGD
jgi:hypothetical protein